MVRGEMRDHTIDNGVSSGLLARVFPRVYAVAAIVDDPAVMRLAALRYAEGRAALSHTSALSEYGLCTELPHAVHLTVSTSTRLRSRRGLVVHRRNGFTVEPPQVLHRGGLPLVRLDRALVEAWPLVPPVERRAAVIAAVRQRRTTPARIRAELAGLPRLPDRRSLQHVLALLDAGCQSELEIWGLEQVFDHPALPPSVAQHPVRVGGRVVYLDRAYLVERVAVEMDGAAYHDNRSAFEHDRRRDALIARLGWLTVRFGYQRLVGEPDAVHAELREILAVRRRQLAG